jgi:hypothetical protein
LIRIEFKKFNELEQVVNPLKDQIQNNYMRMSKRVNEIKVKGMIPANI